MASDPFEAVTMPGMDGFDTAREIRSLALAKPPVLVAVSGHGDAATRRRAAEAGFDLHLLKPVAPSVFQYLPIVADGKSRVVLEESKHLGERIAELDARNRESLQCLAASYAQMGHSLLLVITTTKNEAPRERCQGKARRICDRLALWVERYPYLAGIRVDLAELMRLLPR